MFEAKESMIKGYRSGSNDIWIKGCGLLIERLCCGSYDETLITAAWTQDWPGTSCEVRSLQQSVLDKAEANGRS